MIVIASPEADVFSFHCNVCLRNEKKKARRRRNVNKRMYMNICGESGREEKKNKKNFPN